MSNIVFGLSRKSPPKINLDLVRDRRPIFGRGPEISDADDTDLCAANDRAAIRKQEIIYLDTAYED